MLRDIIGFVERQKKTTYGLGYKLTISKKDDVVIDKAPGNDDARIKIDHIHWYVPDYTPSIQEQGILSRQISRKTLTEELRYIERSVFKKDANNQNQWIFELCSQESMNVPIRIPIRFRQ